MNVIERIEELLQERGWSRYKLAKESGLPQSTITSMLGGKVKNPSHESLSKIADAFGISISTLLGEKEYSTTEDKIRELIIELTKTRAYSGRIESDIWNLLDQLCEKYNVKFRGIDATSKDKFKKLAEALINVDNDEFKINLYYFLRKIAKRYYIIEDPIQGLFIGDENLIKENHIEYNDKITPTQSEQEFITDLELSNLETLKKFNLKLDGKNISEKEAQGVIAYLRSLRQFDDK